MKASSIAKKLLEFYDGDKTKWTQFTSFRNAEGLPCGCNNAQSYCLMGAIYEKDLDVDLTEFRRCFYTTSKWYGSNPITAYNDAPNRTFGQVQRKLKAIANGTK